MIMPERFFFRGHAVGAAATVRRMRSQAIPERTLPTQAASSLPVTGGRSEQVIQGSTEPDLNPFLSFQTARTFADGRYDAAQKANVTEVSATVTGVQLAGQKFTADRIHARLLSVHEGCGRQPSISWTGTELAGLKLEGYALEVVLDPVLEPMTREDEIVHAYGTEPFHTTHGKRFFRRGVAGGPDPIPRLGKDGYIGFSIVDHIRTDHPNAQIDGHKLTLEHFGTLYFGEMLVGPETRRLTLVRFQLGCPEEGEGGIGDVTSNGEILP